MFEEIRVFVYNRQEYEQYKNAYSDHPVLKVRYGNIFNDKSDAFVTAGNSFAMCDGGIDGHMNVFFGMIEKRIQQKVLDEWRGELPVGASLLFDTPENSHFRYLCYSPTMRIPMRVPDSINAYLAMRGALVECSKVPTIKTISVPLLCRGVGLMEIGDILKQIWHAYNTVVHPTPRNWRAITQE